MVAVGDQFGRVAVWNLSSNHIADTFRQKGSISGLEFLGAYPILAVSNGTPTISLYALEPQIQHGSCILTINSQAADITSSIFVNNRRILYVSDAAGYVWGFDLNPLVDQNQVLPMTKRQKKPEVDRSSDAKHHLRISTMKQLISNARTAAAHGAPLTIKFQAGACIITSIGLIEDPLSLFALSLGPHLTVWSAKGQKLGTLGTLDICRRSKQKEAWKFPVNTMKRLHHADTVARQVLQSLVFQTKHHSLGSLKLDGDRKLQSSEGRTFITQKKSLPNIRRPGASSVAHTHLRRNRSELLPASVFSSDGETMTREKRQEIRRLKRSLEQSDQIRNVGNVISRAASVCNL